MADRLSLRARAASGEFVLGTLITELTLPTLPVMLSSAGFDFVVIDMEHGSYDLRAAADLFVLCRLNNIAPLVRPPGHASEYFRRLLGLGATGVMVPNVETVTEAQRVVYAARYPPEGTRGVSAHSAQVDFQRLGLAEMTQAVNETTFVMVQIESELGVSHADEILSVGGIDAVLIGPGDLSLNLGIPGQYNHPQFDKAVNAVFAAAKQNTVVSGIHCINIEMVRKWHAAGAGLLTYSHDTGFLDEAIHNAGQILADLKG